MAAVSRTLRDTTNSKAMPAHASPTSGPREMRPRVGFSPTRPHWLAGLRMDPPPSLAWATGTMPDATAAAAPPEDPPRELTELKGPHPLAGATVANMSPALADELGLETIEAGVIVMGFRRGSSASRLGFRSGDMVRSVNGEHVDSVRRLKVLVAAPADRWRITLQRNGKTLNMVINR